MKNIYGYTKLSSSKKTVKDQQDSIALHVVSKTHPTGRHAVPDDYSEIEYLDEKTIDAVIDKLKREDILFVDSIDILGNSLFKILNIIHISQNKGIKLYLCSENILLENCTKLDVILPSLVHVGRAFIDNRTQAAEKTRRKKNIKLGRKKGTQYKSKYDVHKKDIKKLYEFGLSKKKIIEKIGVGTPQSLTSYINTKILKTKKAPITKAANYTGKDDRWNNEDSENSDSVNYVEILKDL